MATTYDTKPPKTVIEHTRWTNSKMLENFLVHCKQSQVIKNLTIIVLSPNNYHLPILRNGHCFHELSIINNFTQEEKVHGMITMHIKNRQQQTSGLLWCFIGYGTNMLSAISTWLVTTILRQFRKWVITRSVSLVRERKRISNLSTNGPSQRVVCCETAIHTIPKPRH